jgi:hypothetical protein
MDGTSLKNSYHKALSNSDMYYNLTIVTVVSLILGLILNSYILIIPNAILSVAFFTIAAYNQKISERAMDLYSWKYDADDLFDNEEDDK